MQHHGMEEWQGVVSQLEVFLPEFFKEIERCRADCQGNVEMKSSEFITGISGF